MNQAPISWAGGVNLFADPSQIKDNQVRLTKNMMPTDGGLILASRPAMKVASELYEGNSDVNIIPLRAQRSALGGVDLVYYDTAADFVRFVASGSAPVNAAGAGIRNLPISLVTFNGQPYCFTGQGPGYRVGLVAGVPTAEQLQFLGVGNSAFRPVGAAPVRARMCYWAGRELVFSDTNAPLLIRDNSAVGVGTILVAVDTPGDITHVQELNTTASGSPVQSVVAVWTADAMYMLLGEPGETGAADAAGTLQVNKLTIASGCVSGATVVQTPYGTLWAGADDVWFLPFGSLPIRVGTNIRPALLNTPPALRYRWHAAYENGIYRLAVDAPGAGPTEISGCSHHWLLDMRNGPPQSADTAVWWGPQEYNPSGSDIYGPGTWAFITSDTGAGTQEVLAVQPWSAEDDTGSANGVSLCTLNAADSRDEAAPNYSPNPPRGVTAYSLGDIVVPYDEDYDKKQWAVWKVTSTLAPPNNVTAAEPLGQFNDLISVSKTSDGVTFSLISGSPLPRFIPTSAQSGNEVIPEFRSKEYLGDPDKDKLYDGTAAGYWVNRRGIVEYSALTDIDASKRVLEENGTDSAQSRMDMPSSNLQRIWKSRLLTPQVGRRFHAKSLQFVMSHATRFVIDATNDIVLYEVAYGDRYRVQVKRGEYASLADLCNQITLDMSDAGVSDGWTLSTLGNLVSAVTSPVAGWRIFFDVSASGVEVGWSTEDYNRCARLFSMLGVDTNNNDWYSTSPLFEWRSLKAAPSRVRAKSPAERTRTFRSAFSSLKMNVDTFSREPT